MPEWGHLADILGHIETFDLEEEAYTIMLRVSNFTLEIWDSRKLSDVV